MKKLILILIFLLSGTMILRSGLYVYRIYSEFNLPPHSNFILNDPCKTETKTGSLDAERTLKYLKLGEECEK